MVKDVFQDWIDRNQQQLTTEDLEALMDVMDTLRPADAAAQTAFGAGKYTPANVIAIAALMLERLPRERRRIPQMPRPEQPAAPGDGDPF